jgi:TolB protein
LIRRTTGPKIALRLNLTRIFLFSLFFLAPLLFSIPCSGKIVINIDDPSARKLNIAIPDFKNLSENEAHPELASAMSNIISNDLDLSGYFNPVDKRAFLAGKDSGMTKEEIRFKNWSVIGAELLLKASYNCIGRSVEVEFRLFDVFWGRQLLGKRILGDLNYYRQLVHRIGNEIIKTLTGHDGIFLTKLVFIGNTSGHKEIFISDFDGHGAKQVSRDKSIALLPRWSPRGNNILFNSYREGGGPLLYNYDLTSGKVRKISSRPGLNTGAAWSPDGKRIALTLSHKGDPNIFLMGLNGKIIKQLTKHWGIDVSPTFSPDGKKMAFVSNRSGSPQIYVFDLQRGTEQRITFGESSYNTSPSWSSRNKIAFVAKIDGNFEICTMDPNGGQWRRLTSGTRNNEDPCWSPDGRYIIYSSNREGRYHLYLMNANGHNQNQITSGKGNQTAPSWSPLF